MYLKVMKYYIEPCSTFKSKLLRTSNFPYDLNPDLILTARLDFTLLLGIVSSLSIASNLCNVEAVLFTLFNLKSIRKNICCTYY